jgi:hypothetical protein
VHSGAFESIARFGEIGFVELVRLYHKFTVLTWRGWRLISEGSSLELGGSAQNRAKVIGGRNERET